MIDGELPMGDDGAVEQGGGEIPPGYDPSFMGEALSPEDYAQHPDPLKARFQRFARKNQEMKQQLESERQLRMAQEARLAVLESTVNKPAEKPKEGMAAYTDAQLKEWKAKALRTQAAFFADPTNEDLKAAASQINPEHLIAVDDELIERRARAVAEQSVGSLKGEIAAGKNQESFERRVGLKYGEAYVRKGTPEYQAAVAEFAEIARDFDVSNDSSGAYTVLAIERAKAKLGAENRDGRGGDAALRRLAIEGSGRREAQSGNSVAALRAKGDWKSNSKATDIELDAFLKQHLG